MIRKYISLLAIVLFLSLGCEQKHDKENLDAYFRNKPMHFNRKLTDVIVADIFTPPVASRIYAYSNIAAYEGMRFLDSSRASLAGQLNGLESLPQPDPDKSYYFPLVSQVAFTEVAQALVFDLERVQELQKDMLDDVKEIGINKEIFENSLAFGKDLAAEILVWARNDGYNRRTALPRYSVNDNPGRWRPTPPDYMEAIEPHWNTIRPFVLDSAGQFDPGPPTPFETDTDSRFYMEAMEVYDAVQNLNPEQLEIAKFWDCNPNISYTKGHVMYFQQKISPGGHWLHITAQALEDLDAGPEIKTGVFAQVSIALADAFISCWDQKFKSNLTRPETFINTHIDPEWTPILQTPAFPEHTSGHSVASNAAATVLTELIGDNYAFIDSTEVNYGLPKRNFTSFMQAAGEAAISRLYGGIHYRPAIELGTRQGKDVGNFILEKIRI